MEIYETLEKRSKWARLSAWLSVLLIVITVFLMIFFFYSENSGIFLPYQLEAINVERSIEKEKLEVEKAKLEAEKAKLEAEKAKIEAEKAKLELSIRHPYDQGDPIFLDEIEKTNDIEKLSLKRDLEETKLDLERTKLDLERTKFEQSSEDVKRITSIITEFITKIGTVIIALYMVQILLGLTRYHFRLADHLAIAAVAIKHSDSDIEKIEQFIAAVGTNHIDFGKAPTTPINRLMETIKELPDKIATTKSN